MTPSLIVLYHEGVNGDCRTGALHGAFRSTVSGLLILYLFYVRLDVLLLSIIHIVFGLFCLLCIGEQIIIE